jgi:alkaline phosphatase D
MISRPVAAGLAAILLVAGLAALAASERLTPVGPSLLVTVGEVTATSAVVWVRSGAGSEVALEYGRTGAEPARATIAVRTGHDSTGTLTLQGLRPATRYGYRLRAQGQSVGGEFVTAPGPGAEAAVRFVWSGDLGGQRFCRRVDGGYPIFDTVVGLRPDFFLFLGDTIYADSRCDRPGLVPGADFIATTLPRFHDKHRYNRADAAVQRLFRTASVYAIWDDHEVRNDFAGPTEPLMPAGRRSFLDYWPIQPPRDEPERLYRRARWGKLLELFILDTRQYRSANAEPDGPSKTMLGAAQRRWLIDGVTASTAVWKVVATSVSLSVPRGPRTARDTWSNASIFGLPEEGGTGFAVERDALLGALRSRGVRNLIFLAADAHYALVARHSPFPDWSVHEMMAGPLSAAHGRPVPLDDGLNPSPLFERGGVNNVGLIAIDPAALTVHIVDEAGQTLFTHTIPSR